MRRTAIAIALLCAAASVMAGVREGMDALARREYAEARRQFEALPTDPDALYQLAQMAARGLGEPADQAKAAGLFARASDAGSKDATLVLARLFIAGLGIAKDEQRGLALLAKLAESGMPRAQLLYGFAVEMGDYGAKKDEAAAAEWYRHAMEGGNNDGLVNYARMLTYGRGVPQDQVKAAQILKAAADRGFPQAVVAYGRLLRLGYGVPKDEAEAFKLFQRGAETGYPDAQYEIGDAMLSGRGVARDPREAARWIDAAARQGNMRAQYLYAEMFRTGVGVPASNIDAYKWYTIAGAPPRTGIIVNDAEERRARMAINMSTLQIEDAVRRAGQYRVELNVRPAREKPAELLRGDRYEVGGTRINVPLPRGYVNGWEFAEKARQRMPNLGASQADVVLVGIHQDDLDRIKLGVRIAELRMVEFLRYEGDPTVDVTAPLFSDLRTQFRESFLKLASTSVYKVLRDDDRALLLMRVTQPTGQSEGAIVGLGLLRLNDRIVMIRLYSGSGTEEAQKRIADVEKEWTEVLVSAN
ncbi:MAG TPA: tetratricopeptide repeat protein [Burkholderiales bacterium]|nr:tetratricopeptide repeat protein [Burkholderiales bacterium]